MKMTPLINSRSVTVFGGAFLVAYLVIRAWKKSSSKRKYPPGYPSLPVVGSLPFLPPYDKMHTAFLAKSETLGPVFSVNFGGRYMIVLHGWDAHYEALCKKSHEFASRPLFYVNHCLFNPRWKGIIDRPYNAGFKKYHQLTLSILKDFGFGQTIMEDRIHIEVEELIRQLTGLSGASTYPKKVITRSVLNVIASIIFGERFESADPKLSTIIDNIHGFIYDSIEIVPVNMLSSLRFLPSMRASICKLLGYQSTLFAVIDERIADSLAGRSGVSFASRFVDAEGPAYDKEELLYTMWDLLLAGTETSATMLQWAAVTMANHPEVQRRVQAEIDSVVTRDRLPSLTDKAKLPYAEATICELLRRRTIVPLGLPHETVADTEVGGYFVPAGTGVFTNLYSCHMDPKVWKDPEAFRPERFLSAEGKVILRDRIVSFSMGTRSCTGELLARQEIFLFFTGLLQNFNLLPPEGQKVVEFKEEVSVTVGPQNYELRFVPRPVA